jgi:hypothetical protein
VTLTTRRAHAAPGTPGDAFEVAPGGSAQRAPEAGDLAPCESISVTAVDASHRVSIRDFSINVSGAAEGVARDVSHLITTTIFRGFSE